MVDFRPQDISLYLPRNLSSEEDYHSHVLVATQLYETLKLRHYLPHSKASIDEAMDLSQTGDACNGLTVNTDKASSDSSCSPRSPTSFFLPTSEQTEKVLVDSPQSPKMANGNDKIPSSTDLSCYLKDLSLSSPGAVCSDNETVFSEDYTAMTDVGDGSEQGDVAQSKDSSFCSDIDSTYSETSSNRSSLSIVQDDDQTSQEGEKSKNKNKPNIKLLLGQKPNELPDWTDTPSCSLGNSPDSPEAQTKSADDCPFFEDREFDFLRTEPVKRSTSLKTYKTPPGTPGRKKAVRFADALGLDLESVRHILNLDEPPKVPASAMKDLQPAEREEEKKVEGIRYLSINFPQPGVSPTFFQRVSAQKVLLENCVVDDKQLNISGTVRVANINYHKRVTVRFTINNWLTNTDVMASYVQNSNDGPSDRFSFSISVPPYFGVGSRLQFCIRYQAGTDDFWDSNYGNNYVIECYAKAVPNGEKDSAWMHFL